MKDSRGGVLKPVANLMLEQRLNKQISSAQPRTYTPRGAQSSHKDKPPLNLHTDAPPPAGKYPPSVPKLGVRHLDRKEDANGAGAEMRPLVCLSHRDRLEMAGGTPRHKVYIPMRRRSQSAVSKDGFRTRRSDSISKQQHACASSGNAVADPKDSSSNPNVLVNKVVSKVVKVASPVMKSPQKSLKNASPHRRRYSLRLGNQHARRSSVVAGLFLDQESPKAQQQPEACPHNPHQDSRRIGANGSTGCQDANRQHICVYNQDASSARGSDSARGVRLTKESIKNDTSGVLPTNVGMFGTYESDPMWRLRDTTIPGGAAYDRNYRPCTGRIRGVRYRLLGMESRCVCVSANAYAYGCLSAFASSAGFLVLTLYVSQSGVCAQYMCVYVYMYIYMYIYINMDARVDACMYTKILTLTSQSSVYVYMYFYSQKCASAGFSI
jgi:hypothetical protein